ncbi:LOW QUALITY PROTEIN: tetrahydroberberine oxidase-like [Lycium ferocissimum]|uniref:LOW QUALITY PROTEIN: tetrahydroberberine oxidase-like n=1 Tax=Lycium ferocissimum TaxID=112874 RepID=UPI0028168B1D|nr:LOW QUALITY PROTEIN: tetrahydroberberine oxidase-like [Lycium ferocissimum]
MGPHISLVSFLLVLFVFSSTSWATLVDNHEEFIRCLSNCNQTSSVYTPNNSSYSSILQFSIQNLRFNTTKTPKPLVIVTPTSESEVQQVIICAKKTGMHIRVRGGGHDYEGLSYVTEVPFVIIDLIEHRAINVNVNDKSAWVEAGATNGELYYRIAEKSKTLGFPAGVCPTVGVGGHFSGGGYGLMLRKYGIAADNIVDARLIDANGRILDRVSMGEDLFWAIRGGGGNSFGLVLSWKIKLVDVPEKVTVFTLDKTLEQNATKLVHKWQYVGSRFHEDLFIRILISRLNSSSQGGNNNQTIIASFNSMFLGEIDRLLPIMQENFPELGLRREECIEMSWIESTLYFAGFSRGESLDVLLNRTQLSSRYFKAKSDYVYQPIPEGGLEGIWRLFFEDEAASAQMILSPYGGRMNEIASSSIPFPHRAGNLYKIQHLVYWDEEGEEVAEKHISWIRRLYSYMTPFVSMFPRAAYINYRDLDIGVNNIKGYTSYLQAKVWGTKYFKNNFNRLVFVKTKVDPSNFFRNKQSIPSIHLLPLYNYLVEDKGE